eukprot:CAMPEP_0184664494 /NCGR_PEP_ID=MMETSP0308-20130426/53111_1 /TAXON_ID=38269 /ORGANISM="Gloeochaete witrockiana, Strain SAG 46.84" /LENGTH=792 /DNA_ID=CAMNT_0027107931 /DNA_START=98 /DNA_END=2476 /DNA_ORIENTATION=+
MFMLLRKRFKTVYEPRTLREDSLFPPPPAGIFAFVHETLFGMNNDEYYRACGIDAVMFLRFVHSCLRICAMQLLYGFIILIPVTATSPNATGMTALTMTAIPKGSNRLVAQIFSVVYNSCICYLVLWYDFRAFVRFRTRHMSAEIPENYTVMVTDVPAETSDEDLNSKLKGLFKEQLVKVNRTYHHPALHNLLRTRERTIVRLEHIHGAQRHRRKWQEWRRVQLMTELPELKEKLKSLDDEIPHVQDKIVKGEVGSRNEVFFVMFSSVSGALSAFHNATIKFVLPSCNVYRAPEPADVCWSFLFVTLWPRVYRLLAVNALLFWFFLLASIPMVFITGLNNLTALGQIEVFSAFANHLDGVARAFIEGFIASLVLVLTVLLLPPFFRAIAKRQGMYSWALLHRYVMWRVFLFQVFDVFVVSTLAGAVLSQLFQLLGDPSKTLDTIVKSLPQQSTYYTNYILLLGLAGQPFLLLRPHALIKRSFRRFFLCTSQLDFALADRVGVMDYTLHFSFHTSILAIVLCYSTMSPLILIFAVIYYSLAYFSARYNFLHVFEEDRSFGGMLWSSAFDQAVAGVIIYQVLMIGIFLAYDFWSGALISGLMIGATTLFRIMSMTHYQTDLRVRSTEACAAADVVRHDTHLERWSSAYVNPDMFPLKVYESSEFRRQVSGDSEVHSPGGRSSNEGMFVPSPPWSPITEPSAKNSPSPTNFRPIVYGSLVQIPTAGPVPEFQIQVDLDTQQRPDALTPNRLRPPPVPDFRLPPSPFARPPSAPSVPRSLSEPISLDKLGSSPFVT